VLLGNTAAVSLIKKNIKITQQRGTWDVYKGIPVMMTYHPAALLRDDSKNRYVERFKERWKKLQGTV
jgi:DNA polymerase